MLEVIISSISTSFVYEFALLPLRKPGELDLSSWKLSITVFTHLQNACTTLLKVVQSFVLELLIYFFRCRGTLKTNSIPQFQENQDKLNLLKLMRSCLAYSYHMTIFASMFAVRSLGLQVEIFISAFCLLLCIIIIFIIIYVYLKFSWKLVSKIVEISTSIYFSC